VVAKTLATNVAAEDAGEIAKFVTVTLTYHFFNLHCSILQFAIRNAYHRAFPFITPPLTQ
jgi:hypothetical protein